MISTVHQEVIRSRVHVAMFLVYAALCGVIIIPGVFVAAGKSNPLPQIILVLLFLALGAWCVKAAFASIVVTSSEVVVRNTVRTYRIAVPDLEGFEVVQSPVRGQLGQIFYNVKVRTKDGSLRICSAARHVGMEEASRVRARLDTAMRYSHYEH